MPDPFNPNLAPLEARTPPARWYISETHHTAERARVLSANWQVIAHQHEFSTDQTYLSGCVGREPWVLTRDGDGTVRAFANVCRHNGTRLVEGEGTGARLTCPYHGWRYHLDGRLDAAPKCPASDTFRPSEFGLIPLPLITFGPMWLVNASGSADTPAWMEVAERLEATNWGNLEHRARRTYHLRCNWKVFVDNYLDGGYHVPLLHPALSSQLSLRSYTTEVLADHVVQSAAPSRKAGERLNREALYVWIYPNLMINRYGPVMDTNVVTPTGPETCRVDFDWYFEPGCTEAFVAESVEASEQVQQEDIDICERLQEGLRSMHAQPGPYVPDLEEGKYLFHRRVHGDLTDPSS